MITNDGLHIDIVKLLLNDNRVDINQADKYDRFYVANNKGATPFHSACYNGYIEIVKLLLNNNSFLS